MSDVSIPIRPLREMHLFAGCGGGILGGILLGHTCVCAVEIEPYCRKVLLQRQRDGILPKFPIWDDVRTFDGRPWRGKVDVVCGGFPCQDISEATNRVPQKGIDGARSGLWEQMFRVVLEIRPNFVFVENTASLSYRGLGRVLLDLAGFGYNARWGVFHGFEVGAPHKRSRMFIVANPDGFRWAELDQDEQQECSGVHIQNFEAWRHEQAQLQIPMGIAYDPPIRGVLRNDDGLAEGVDRVKAVGNGQISSVVKFAWQTLSQ